MRFAFGVVAAAIIGSTAGCSQCSGPPKPESAVTKPATKAEPSGGGGIETLEVTEPRTGKGALAAEGKHVSILYKATFLDGRIFDERSDRAKPYTFRLGEHEVIAGLDAGLKGMRVGGQRRLVIPAFLGYGARGFPEVVPPNTPLVFQVELVDVRE